MNIQQWCRTSEGLSLHYVQQGQEAAAPLLAQRITWHARRCIPAMVCLILKPNKAARLPSWGRQGPWQNMCNAYSFASLRIHFAGVKAMRSATQHQSMGSHRRGRSEHRAVCCVPEQTPCLRKDEMCACAPHSKSHQSHLPPAAWQKPPAPTGQPHGAARPCVGNTSVATGQKTASTILVYTTTHLV